jgi:iron complex transport system substrate-binding protein
MAVSRRSFLLGAVGVAALSACGGGDEPAGAGSTGSSAGPVQGSFPRTVKHELGETQIPAAPQRVVAATDGGELCSLVALGVRPVGFGQRNKPLRSWLRGKVDGVETYDLAGGETSFERLAAWRPDLLLVQNGFATADNLSKFSALAPAVATSFVDWRANLRQVGEAVGRSEDAARLEKATDDEVAAAKTRFAAFAGLKVRAVTAFDDGSVYLLNDQSPLGKLAPALGLAPFPAQRTKGEAVDTVSLEQLNLLDGDVLLVQHFGEGDGTAALKQRAVFKNLPVVSKGKVVDLSEDESHASYFDSVLTIALNVAMLEKHLSAVVR